MIEERKKRLGKKFVIMIRRNEDSRKEVSYK